MARSFSNDRIIAIQVSKHARNNLVGITADGNERHIGGPGGKVDSVVNSGAHAVITTEYGNRVLYDFATENYRSI